MIIQKTFILLAILLIATIAISQTKDRSQCPFKTEIFSINSISFENKHINFTSFYYEDLDDIVIAEINADFTGDFQKDKIEISLDEKNRKAGNPFVIKLYENRKSKFVLIDSCLTEFIPYEYYIDRETNDETSNIVFLQQDSLKETKYLKILSIPR